MNIDKLPKWAQEHIADLQRQRNEAVRALNEHLDNETPSPFYGDAFECISSPPEHKRYYFQCHKHMMVEHNSVLLDIILRDDIELSWRNTDEGSRIIENVAFVPTSFMQARLVAVSSKKDK